MKIEEFIETCKKEPDLVKSLSHKTRLDILDELKKKDNQTLTELWINSGKQQPYNHTISHIRLLESVGLVRLRQKINERGKSIYVTLAFDRFKKTHNSDRKCED